MQHWRNLFYFDLRLFWFVFQSQETIKNGIYDDCIFYYGNHHIMYINSATGYSIKYNHELIITYCGTRIS